MKKSLIIILLFMFTLGYSQEWKYNLEEAKKDQPNLERMIINEKRLRKANEGRARNKNTIDELFKKIVE